MRIPFIHYYKLGKISQIKTTLYVQTIKKQIYKRK